MSFKSNRQLSAIACALPLLGNAGSAAARITDEQFARLEAKVQREEDARAVANLMGVRSVYGVTGRLGKSLELFSTRQPDVSLSMNGNTMIVGLDAFKKTFLDSSRQQRDLEQMIKVFPQIENKPENYGVGNVSFHALVSPIIEVAQDGNTAKGFWQTIGPQLIVSMGAPRAQLSIENYGADFIKEDGQWKLWHVHVYTELSYDLSKPFAEQLQPPQPAAPGGVPSGPPPGPAYQPWSPTRVPKPLPLPQPYRTFSETFSYGPAATK